ncbi:MAG TPA: hypothetical protein VL400_20090 [Polyangiaceae bacterium]|jgi:hypothetical protein|nr:hypothetical protein [Polyangiaceae bacterium]
MNAIIQKLVAEADLSPEQAAKVAEVLKNFLGEKLPDIVREPVMSALSGDNVDAGADMLKGALGGLFK